MLNEMYCYIIITSPRLDTEAAAESDCQTRGGNLASIHSDAERNFVGGDGKVSLILSYLGLCGSGPGEPCWIGGMMTATCPGSGMPGANCWMWTDGTPVS